VKQPRTLEYETIRAMLLWICHVRPDPSAFVSIVASITAETYNVHEDVKIAKGQKAFLKRTSKVGLHFPRLDYDSLQFFLLHRRELCQSSRQGQPDQICNLLT
jgi:hypothetical protein